jgi:predicted ATP-grasp superfamily ATP-dependent carboligase
VLVADVVRRADLPGPAVRLDPRGLPCDRRWLVKPLASAGGEGVHVLGPGEEPTQRPVYYQERIAGLHLSAVFVGRHDGATLAGVTRQWVGRPHAPFGYAGSVGPWPVSATAEARIEALGRVLALSFDLVGLFGVDLILRDGIPWPVEVNPRYTASVEVLELALGRSLFAEHCRACAPKLDLPDAPGEPGRTDRTPVVGKMILFATRRCRFPEQSEWPADDFDPFRVPQLADVPHPGTSFEPGEPVLTLLAAATSVAACRARLLRERSRWLRRL